MKRQNRYTFGVGFGSPPTRLNLEGILPFVVTPSDASPYTVIEDITEVTDVAEVVFELPSTSEEITLVGDFVPQLDSTRLVLQYSTDNMATWETVDSEYRSCLMNGADTSSSVVIRGAADATLVRGTGNDHAMSITLRIFNHADASKWTQAAIQSVCTSPNNATRQNTGAYQWEQTTVATHARLIMHQGNIADAKFMVVGGPHGEFLPYTEGEVFDVGTNPSVLIPTSTIDNPLWNLSGLNLQTDLDDDYLELAVVEDGDIPSTADWGYHLNKSSSGSTSYDTAASTSEPNATIAEHLSSDPLSGYHPNIIIPDLRKGDGKYKQFMGLGTQANTVNATPEAQLARSTMVSEEVNNIAALEITVALSFFQGGSLRLRELALYSDDHVGTSYGPFTLLERLEVSALSEVELLLPDDKGLRHYFLLLGTEVSFNGSNINLQLRQNGSYNTSNKYHVTTVTANSGNYGAGNSGTGAAYAQFFRGNSSLATSSGNSIVTLSPTGVAAGYFNGTSINVNSNTTAGFYDYAGRTDSTNDVEAVKFLAASGTFSGTILHIALGVPTSGGPDLPADLQADL
jgi:hypothetical protein